MAEDKYRIFHPERLVYDVGGVIYLVDVWQKEEAYMAVAQELSGAQKPPTMVSGSTRDEAALHAIETLQSS